MEAITSEKSSKQSSAFPVFGGDEHAPLPLEICVVAAGAVSSLSQEPTLRRSGRISPGCVSDLMEGSVSECQVYNLTLTSLAAATTCLWDPHGAHSEITNSKLPMGVSRGGLGINNLWKAQRTGPRLLPSLSQPFSKLREEMER